MTALLGQTVPAICGCLGATPTGTTYGYLNDLWRYDPATGQWTWMSGAETADQVGNFGSKGVPDAHNVPGARQYSVSWTDSVGNLWLFGGSVKVGTNINGHLNDLWRYEVPQCVTSSDCAEGYECVEGECVQVVVDNPPQSPPVRFWHGFVAVVADFP